MIGPQRVAKVLLALILAGSIYLDYWQYSREYHQNPGIWLDVISGTANAPQQYRIGVVKAAKFLASHAHAGLRHGFTLIDLTAAFVAVFTLFFLFERSEVYRRASTERQWFGAAAFVVMVEFYLAWLLWYQRPETLPTTALLALVLLLLTVKSRRGEGTGIALSIIGLLMLTVVQGFVRADVAVAVHLGVLMVCLTRAGGGFALGRGVQALTSGTSVLMALGIQYYLMRVAYPQAGYGDTRVFQLFLNLQPNSGWIPIVVFLAPFVWTIAALARRGWRAETPAQGMLAGGLVFAGMWSVLGRMQEVRIFMPFAVVLIPLTTTLAMETFLPVPLPFQTTSAGR